MRIALLGPLELRDDAGGAVDVAGPRLRRLLARLALDPGRPVGTAALTDAIWGDEPPAGAASALHSLVSRLRYGLPDGDGALLESLPAGYRLRIGAENVDVGRFEHLAAEGRAARDRGEQAAALESFGRALALWRGEPLADLGRADFAQAAAVRLSELRLRTVEDRVELRLTWDGQGHGDSDGHGDDGLAEAVAELGTLVAAHPLRERMRALYMRALCAAGRPGEALETFEQLRRVLGQELGADPSPGLRELHVAILRGELGPRPRPQTSAEAAVTRLSALPSPSTGTPVAVATTAPDPRSTSAPASAGRGALRHALTSFVGREEELERVGGLLGRSRLITLVGPGGAGKTRLALEIARRCASAPAWIGAGRGDTSPGGRPDTHTAGLEARFVELAAVHDPGRVADAVLDALGLRDSGLLPVGPRATPAPTPGPAVSAADSGVSGDSGANSAASARSPIAPAESAVLSAESLATDTLIDALRDRRVLIVLDNCEHLIDACAHLADALLGACAQVCVLATSREALAITGEVLCPVGPLPVPPPDAGLDQALGFAATRLFADRAAAVRPGFTVTAHNLAAVGAVCRTLDGLPLALELACARLRTLPVDELAARLDDRFGLLRSGSRTAPERHRTLRGAVEWSWDLLTAPERALARRLAVFVGGADAHSARSVCAGAQLATEDVSDLLDALVDKSLLELVEQHGTPPRYRMLETIRAYAAEALDAAAETERTRSAHAAYFLAQAEAAEPLLRTSEQLGRLAWLTAEYGNLTAALDWALERGAAQTAIRLAAALGWFWEMRGANAEAAAWLRRILPRVPDAALPPGPLAVAYAFDAMHHFAAQDPERALASAASARRLVRKDEEGRVTQGADTAAATGTSAATTHPIVLLMGVLLQDPEPGPDPESQTLAATGSAPSTMPASPAVPAGLAALARHEDPWTAAAARLFLAHAAEFSGDAAGALAHFAAARDLFAGLGDRWGVVSALGSLGAGRGLAGDHAAAIAELDEARQLAQALGAEDETARIRAWRGFHRLRAGDRRGAGEDFTRAGADGRARHSAQIAAFADVGLAELARYEGDLTAARRLLIGALDWLDRTDTLPEVTRVQALTALGRTAVAEGELDDAHQRLAAALKLALAMHDGPTGASVGEALADLALARNRPDRAARFLGLAAAARGAADRGSPDVARTESAARAARPDAFDAEYAAAAGLCAADALAALAGTEV